MGDERQWALLWLPGAFALEVLAWEADSRLELGLSDPTWAEFGAMIGVEQITWGLGAAVVVLFVVFMIASRHRSTLQLSLVQLLGILALACYWIGAWVVSSGMVVALSTIAAWILGTRRVRV